MHLVPIPRGKGILVILPLIVFLNRVLTERGDFATNQQDCIIDLSAPRCNDDKERNYARIRRFLRKTGLKGFLPRKFTRLPRKGNLQKSRTRSTPFVPEGPSLIGEASHTTEQCPDTHFNDTPPNRRHPDNTLLEEVLQEEPTPFTMHITQSGREYPERYIMVCEL